MDCKHDSKVCCSSCRPDVFNPTEEQARNFAIKALSDRILKAKRAYYTGRSTISDHEYDSLEKTLRVFDPNALALSMVGWE